VFELAVDVGWFEELVVFVEMVVFGVVDEDVEVVVVLVVVAVVLV